MATGLLGHWTLSPARTAPITLSQQDFQPTLHWPLMESGKQKRPDYISPDSWRLLFCPRGCAFIRVYSIDALKPYGQQWKDSISMLSATLRKINAQRLYDDSESEENRVLVNGLDTLGSNNPPLPIQNY